MNGDAPTTHYQSRLVVTVLSAPGGAVVAVTLTQVELLSRTL